MREASSIVIGLPASGKTTYLAALWYVLTDPGATATLRVLDFTGDRNYLNRIARDWLTCVPVERNPRGSITSVSMVVRSMHGGREARLTFPDISGESFELFFERRKWSAEFDALVSAGTGILLFVNPAHVTRADRIDQANMVAHAAGSAPVALKDEAVITEDVPAELTPEAWKPKMVPTAGVLSDLLEAIAEHIAYDKRPIRLALVVSAWDLIDSMGLSPDQWVRRDLALLHQFLRSNKDVFEFRIYGISAQGGDIDDKAVREELATQGLPQNRIIVREQDSTHSDISGPIHWLLQASG